MAGVVVGWAYRQKTGSPTAKAVLVKLAENANEEGEAWPSIVRMVRETELSRRTVMLKLRELEELGLIRIVNTRNGQRQGLNHYFLAYDPQGASDAPGNSQGASDAPQGASDASVRVQDVHPNRHREPSIEPSSRPMDAESSVEEDFNRWWSVYPVKKGKAAALRKYAQARKVATAEALMAGAERVRRDYQSRAPADRRFVKHPSTWLHQGCWEDEDTAAPLTPDSPGWLHFEGHPEPEQGDWRWEPYRTLDGWQKDILRREAREAREAADG